MKFTSMMVLALAATVSTTSIAAAQGKKTLAFVVNGASD